METAIGALRANLRRAICGKDDAIELLLIAFLAGGNILMEDVPGVGKTTLAKALALSIDGKFNRVQFTPDLLPTDILGCSIYNPREGTFSFREGPVFANILLADEINRASPRTQSALLEAMNEAQVSIEGATRPLPKPFLVIATENPVEYQGTYPLPEAQLDRFAMQLAIGYPDEEAELEILSSRKTGDPLSGLVPVINAAEIIDAQKQVRDINIEPGVAKYMANLVRATRTDPNTKLGASPRALMALARCAQAKAYLCGRDYVTPDDAKSLCVPVLAHRLMLDPQATYSGMTKQRVIEEVLGRITVPV
jgi:MoxR-like ATPase